MARKYLWLLVMALPLVLAGVLVGCALDVRIGAYDVVRLGVDLAGRTPTIPCCRIFSSVALATGSPAAACLSNVLIISV